MSERHVPRNSNADEGGAHHRGQNTHGKPQDAEINWVPYTVESHDGLRKLGHEAGVDWHTIYNKNRETLHNKPNLHQAPHMSIMVPDTVERARPHHEQKDSVAELAPAANRPTDNDPLKQSTIAPGNPDYIFAAPKSPMPKDGDGHDLHFTDGLDMAALDKLAKTDPVSAKSVVELRNALRVASQLTINQNSDDPRLGPQGANTFLRKAFDPVYNSFAEHFGQDFGLSNTAEWKYLQGKGLLETNPLGTERHSMVAAEQPPMVAAGESPLNPADPLAHKTDGKNPDYIFASRSVDDSGKDITFNPDIAKSLANIDGSPLHMTDNIDINKLAKLEPGDQNVFFHLRSFMRSLAQAQQVLGPGALSVQRTGPDGEKQPSPVERFTAALERFKQRNHYQDFGLSQTAEWRYLFPPEKS